MHTVFALLCFVVVIHWLISPYPSGLLHWHCGNLTIAPVPAKQPWWIWINTSCEFIMNDCITTTKQSTTKPCAYLLGYTVLWCLVWLLGYLLLSLDGSDLSLIIFNIVSPALGNLYDWLGASEVVTKYMGRIHNMWTKNYVRCIVGIDRQWFHLKIQNRGMTTRQINHVLYCICYVKNQGLKWCSWCQVGQSKQDVHSPREMPNHRPVPFYK